MSTPTLERPRLLDLFCCAGGAGMGYHRAGFDVYGVDISPQPNNPFPFFQGDALDVLRILLAGGSITFSNGETLSLTDFAAIHASPPCHDHSDLSRITGYDGTGDLLTATLALLRTVRLPWVVENVEGATAEMRSALLLCGTQFGLNTISRERGIVWLRRHRLFESNISLRPPDGHRVCTTGKRVIGVYGNGDGGGRGWKGSFADRKAVMNIDWMRREELAQAIPPAYTEWIGAQLMTRVGVSV